MMLTEQTTQKLKMWAQRFFGLPPHGDLEPRQTCHPGARYLFRFSVAKARPLSFVLFLILRPAMLLA